MSEEIVHENGFDPNRGGRVLFHKDSGSKVCMYHDEPGVFFTMSGIKVSDSDAAMVGFDVPGLRKESLKLQKKREAVAKIEAEFEGIDDAVDAEIEAELGLKTQSPFSGQPMETPLQVTGQSRVDSPHVTKRSGEGKPRGTKYHEMRHRGRGRWDVVSSSDESVAITNVDETTAMAFLVDQAEATAATGA